MRSPLSTLTLLAGVLACATSLAQEPPRPAEDAVNEYFKNPDGMPGEAQDDAQVVDKIGAQLPLDTVFDAEDGTKITFGELLQEGKPVLLQFAYYRCPSLCTVTLNSMVDLVNDMRLELGEDFTVVTLSINPQETPNLARAKKEAYLGEVRKPGAEKGWHFLTGNRGHIAKLTKAAGFGFRFDTETREYAHGAAVFVVTPEGKLSRTIYGAMYEPRTVRLSLIEASDGAIGSPLDRIVLYCYHYNPGTGKYSAQIMNIVRLISGVSVLLMAVMIGTFFYRERQERIAQAATSPEQPATSAAESASPTTSVDESAAAPAPTGGVA